MWKCAVASVLISVSLSAFSFGEEPMSGYVEIEIEYRSSFPGYLQIKDEVCKPPRGLDCEKARIQLRTRDCTQKSFSPKCREAEEILASSFCLAGLIYEGRVSRGEKIVVSVCKSLGGFGNLSMRDLKNGEMWTNYFLLNHGDSLKFP
jgi:hypothetical protein